MNDVTVEKFWRRPKFEPSAVGDNSPDMIFLQVGRALTAWERLEDDIASLFSIVTHVGTSENYTMLKHVFGTVESSSSRIGMLRVALSIYFNHHWENSHVSSPFKDALKAVGWASHRRNEIAHGRVTGVLVGQSSGEPPVFSGHFLTAPVYAINRSQPFYGGEWNANDVLSIDRSLYRYRASDIYMWEAKFVMLSALMRDLMVRAAQGEHKLPNIVLDVLKRGLLFKHNP